MGLSIMLALAALAYSLYIQSPTRQIAFQVEPYRLAARIRAATTVAFALLLLTFGFYVAGVPLDGGVAETTSVQAAASVVANGAASGAQVADAEVAALVNATLAAMPTEAADQSSGFQTPASGAFGAPLTDEPEVGEVAVADDGEVSAETNAAPNPDATSTSTPTPAPTETPTNTPTPTPSPTQTPTPLPTATPSPTLTPTPISEPTANISTDGSTLWVKRSPGGQNLVILQDTDLVILLPGNANQAGFIWKEIKTVNGVVGWVQSEFLDFGGDVTDAAAEETTSDE